MRQLVINTSIHDTLSMIRQYSPIIFPCIRGTNVERSNQPLGHTTDWHDFLRGLQMLSDDWINPKSQISDRNTCVMLCIAIFLIVRQGRTAAERHREDTKPWKFSYCIVACSNKCGSKATFSETSSLCLPSSWMNTPLTPVGTLGKSKSLFSDFCSRPDRRRCKKCHYWR